MASFRVFCWLTAIWFKSELDSDTLDLFFYITFVFGVGLPAHASSWNLENVPWVGSNGHMCCRSFKSERTNWAFVSLRWAARQCTSWQHGRCAYLYVWMQPSMCGLSGKGLFSVNQKRDQECTTRPPTSRHVSYSSRMSAPIHWFLSSRLSLEMLRCVSPPVDFVIASCMFALKKYQLLISTCLYFMDSTMDCPWWLQNLYFFYTQEFVLTN